jgi:hypothetical protein
MKVFLSWSGDLSRQIACAFREWLPSVIQAVVPYVSSEDIDKGTRWSSDIAGELAESSFGILCVTKENLVAPWIHFEAGALSKSLEKTNVVPFLYGVKRSEVQGPLLQFQSTIFEKDDIHKLLKSLNQRLPEPERLKDEALAKSFDKWWPDLHSTFNKLEADSVGTIKTSKVARPQADILEEVLELLRTQQRLLCSPDLLLPPGYLADVLHSESSGGLRDAKNIRKLKVLYVQLLVIIRFADESSSDKKLEELQRMLKSFRADFRAVLGRGALTLSLPGNSAEHRPDEVKDDSDEVA